MICPKCGFEQPDNPECMRCGIIVSRYKGPIAGTGPRSTPPAFAAPAPPAPAHSPSPSPPLYGGPPPPPPPLYMPPPPRIAGGTALPPPPPAPQVPPMAAGGGYPPPLPLTSAAGGFPGSPLPDPAGGTLYGGPPPGAVSGTLYQGQPAASAVPAFSSFPVFHGTFEVGKVLSETFSIYFSNFIPFLLLSALVSLPLFGLAAYISSLEKGSQEAIILFFLSLLLQPLMSQVAAAGITYGVYQQMRGNDPSLPDCLGVGFSRLVPVVIVAFLTFLATLAGAVLCVVPGLLIALRLAVVVPVTVEERPGISDAMRRSSYLTEGFRGQVFGVLFVLGIIQQGLTRVAISTVKDLSSLLMVSALVGVLTTGLMATGAAVMYYRLRSVKESVDVDQISSVFA
jgi:hypothetical protein